MRSRASYEGHPIHSALIPFPFAFLYGAFFFHLAGRLLERPAWWTTGSHLALAGIVMALVAAVPGAVDYVYTVPPRSTGQRRARKHALVNLGLPRPQRARRSPDQEDLPGAPGDSGHELAEVEAQRRGRVQVEVGVVRLVEPVEERHPVVQDVPPVQGVVHQQDRERVPHPPRRRQARQEADPPPLHPVRQGSGDGALGELDGGGGHTGDGQVPRQPLAPVLGAPAERPPVLRPQQHPERPRQHQAAEEAAGPGTAVAAYASISHR